MIDIRGLKSLKIAIILFIVTLSVGNVVALEWVSPDSDGKVIGSDYTLNVSDESDSSYDVIFYYSEQGEDNFQQFGEDTQSETYDGTNYWTAELSDPGSGSYTIRANLTNGTSSNFEDRDLTKDQGGPSVEIQDSDLEFVSDNPTVRIVAQDSYSNIDSLTASADFTDVLEEDERDCSSGKKCIHDFDLQTNSLNSGDSISLNLQATDQVGNLGSSSPRLTFDNAFEANIPEFSVEGNEDGIVALEEDVNVDVTVDNIDEETSDEVKVKCLVDGDEVSTSDWDDSEDFSCELPMDEVDDDTVEISVEACDYAGNCEESDEESITFDGSDPVLESFTAVQDYKVFSDDFNVQFEASDSATEISSAEYFFSSTTIPGEGTEADFQDHEFKVETSLLSGDSNEHTVYMRVQDEAGRWSDVESLDFEFYPDEVPKISIRAQEDFVVESNSTGYIDVVVNNTGKLLVNSVEISSSSSLINDTVTMTDLEEAESKNAEFEISPTEHQTGQWDITFTSDDPEASDTVEILVDANEQQRQKVDDRLVQYTDRLEKLRANASDLREDGLDSDLNSSLSSELSDFSATVDSIKGYVESDQYHKALAEVEALDAEYNSASNTLDTVEEQHAANEFRETITMLTLGLVIVLAGIGAFIYTGKRDDLEIPIELPDGWDIPEFNTGIIDTAEELVEGIKERLNEEEEKAEEAFEGFR